MGDYIYSTQHLSVNPYQRWIATYGGEAFALSVQRAIDICGRAAANSNPDFRRRMTEAFITSSRLEFDFWNAAYNLKVWL